MRRRYLGALAALTAIGALLRFPTLDLQSFWLDEAVTVRLVRMDFGGMLEAIPDSESTPPLYYVLAWLWAKVFGTGEVGLRSLSALVGTATIPLAYAAAAQLASRRTALAVAALAAFNPLLVWYSQEARAYALLALLGAVSLLAFARALDRPERGRLALWALASVLALATHYFSAFLVIGEAGFLLVASRLRRGPLVATGAVLAGALALLPLALHQQSLDRADFIRSASLPYRAIRVAKQYLLAFDSPLEVASGILAGIVAATGLVLAFRLMREPERRGLRAAGVVAAAGIGLPLLGAVAGADYFDTRNLLAAWLPAFLLIAAGLTWERAGRGGVAAVALLCALGVASSVGVWLEPRWQRQDWRGLAEDVPEATRPRAIIVSPANGRIPLGLYLEGLGRPVRDVQVEEIVLAATQQRRGRAVHPPKPPRPPTPSHPSFAVKRRTNADTYTLALLEAESAQHLPSETLRSMALAPDSSVVVQQPPR